MMNKRYFTLVLILIFPFFSKGQAENYYGFSWSVGAKSTYNFMGIAARARMLKHIDLDLGGSLSFFNGVGYSGGISYVPLNTKVQPFLGLAYGKSFGGKYDITEKGKNTSFYEVSPIEFVYVKGGVMYELDQVEDQIVKDMPVLFALTFSYRKAISNYSVELVNGPLYKEDRLDSKMADGIGFSFSLIVLFGKAEGK